MIADTVICWMPVVRLSFFMTVVVRHEDDVVLILADARLAFDRHHADDGERLVLDVLPPGPPPPPVEMRMISPTGFVSGPNS